MTYRFEVGYEVENAAVQVEADSRAEAEKKVLERISLFACMDGNVVDWWVNDVKEGEGTDGE